MKKSDFLEFYEKVVKELGLRLEKSYPEFHFCDNAGGLYEEYLNQKTLLRQFYGKGEALMDRHKVCACMLAAIVKVRLLSSDVEDIEYTIENASRVNEQLAFMSSWELFLSFLRAGGADDNMYKEFPKTGHNDSFVDTIVRSLFMANQMNMLSTPLLANIFFLLEKNRDNRNN